MSHGDNDHIGGVPALLESLPVLQVLSSELDRPELQQLHGADLQACVAGQQWQ